MFKVIVKEMRRHLPFTALGAVSGIALMVIITLSKLPARVSELLFYIFHPLHVLLSALVTTAMYRRYKGALFKCILIGYVGSVGIGTLSDTIFPYLGGVLLGAEMEFHLGFIEKWWLVNPLAAAGILIGLLKPVTKFPHAGHVLISTWASLFTLTAFGIADWIRLLPFVFIILLLSVWLPCCTSDIIFPLLFVKK